MGRIGIIPRIEIIWKRKESKAVFLPLDCFNEKKEALKSYIYIEYLQTKIEE